jgi:ATP-dependent exoDNAse (exonuclease V) alpha subunit
LTQAQRDAANMMLEKGFSIVCGPPGVGKTSVLAVIVKYGGDRVLIAALAAAAAQRAKEVTGGRATTIASLTTEGKNSGPVARPDRLVGIDTLIIDEASMVGSRHWRRCSKARTRLPSCASRSAETRTSFPRSCRVRLFLI